MCYDIIDMVDEDIKRAETELKELEYRFDDYLEECLKLIIEHEEYMTSDESIKETIDINEWGYMADGTLIGDLEIKEAD